MLSVTHLANAVKAEVHVSKEASQHTGCSHGKQDVLGLRLLPSRPPGKVVRGTEDDKRAWAEGDLVADRQNGET